MEFDFNPFIRWAAKSTHIINKKYVIAKDCRILYILSGSGTLEIKGHCYPLNTDDMFYYPYGLPYRIRKAFPPDLLRFHQNGDRKTAFQKR